MAFNPDSGISRSFESERDYSPERPVATPHRFEFVLIFFMGGLTLTAMVGREVSFTNAICQIVALAMVHYGLAWARSKSSRFARLIDGTPLILLERAEWRTNTLRKMGVQDDDVMASARESGIKTLEAIDAAILERNGEISVIELRKSEGA